MLYQADLAELGTEDTLRSYDLARDEDDPDSRTFSEEDSSTRSFAEELVRLVLGRRDSIDSQLASACPHWPLERLGAVERNVLRLAVGELQRQPATPAAVVIDEAVDLAKEHGEAGSGGFVNGVLEAVRKQMEPSLEPETPADA